MGKASQAKASAMRKSTHRPKVEERQAARRSYEARVKAENARRAEAFEKMLTRAFVRGAVVGSVVSCILCAALVAVLA